MYVVHQADSTSRVQTVLEVGESNTDGVIVVVIVQSVNVGTDHTLGKEDTVTACLTER